ncbi:MAG: hypothetical protein HYZ84_06930 [Candidatus Omnitrophica bacterium]|nr:hypothetical protein [Candidatus Omnitrophota bacterium]
METLTARQQSILNRVIDTHIQTGQPVGSRTITEGYRENYRTSFSPATVRGEMGLLEEQGYLTHPHTSSGRIPTDRGYRYYVDHDLQYENLPQHIFRELTGRPLTVSEELDFFLERVSKALSSWSQEMGLILMIDESSNPRIFLQGSARILEKPEFQDVKKARNLFEMLEEKKAVANWLSRRTADEKISVSIGRENESEAMNDCAVVAMPCRIHRRWAGAVAVLGPRRMRYARTLPLVASMAKLVEEMFDQRSLES